MLKKKLKNLSKINSPSRASSKKPSSSSGDEPSTGRILTAEGWKRLMIKKHRR